MFRAPMRLRSFLLASAAAIVSASAAAQTPQQAPLPPVTIDAPQQKRATAVRPSQRNTARPARASRVRNPAPVVPVVNNDARGPALTVLTVQQALRDIQQTPGGVAIVPAEAYRNSTVANTIKDILDYVPGVFAQPKWGDDTRLSIRGSGLSRNFHCAASSSTWTAFRSTRRRLWRFPGNRSDRLQIRRGIQGCQRAAVRRQLARRGDQFRDADRARSVSQRRVARFRRLRIPPPAGQAGGTIGPWDGFITASTQDAEGFRDHSSGNRRGSAAMSAIKFRLTSRPGST